MGAEAPSRFSFLFRTDEGRIDRPTWWRGTLPLAGIALAATLGWLLLRPFAHHDLDREPFLAPMTVVAYAYLLAYSFGLMLLGICEYNLSAKRFRARGLPGSLAAALPLGLLFGGAVLFFIPNSFGVVPDWAGPLAIAAMVAVTAWNVVELGIRRDAA